MPAKYQVKSIRIKFQSPNITCTRLQVLGKDHPEFIYLKNDFLKTLQDISVISIIRLQMPDAIKQRHEALKREMSIGSHLPLEQITKRMYHGTSYTCDAMAIIKTRKPCGLTRCSMCGIVKAGNSGTKSKWNGKMYFASNPATALPYSRRPMADSCAPRVMFIADVLAPEYDDVVGTCQEAAALPRYLVIFEREIEY